MSNTPKPCDFLDDADKMRDFIDLNRAEFLASYSYLTPEEYDLTKEHLLDKIGIRKYYVEFTTTYEVYATDETDAEETAWELFSGEDLYVYVRDEAE